MLKKLYIILALALLPITNIFAQDSVELGFFADQNVFKVEERKKLVTFLAQHQSSDKYEFELHSFLDPLKIGLDKQRLKDIEALFRQYGVDIEGLLGAKLKFIASDKQQLVVIRKNK